jgi:hypothetical protein
MTRHRAPHQGDGTAWLVADRAHGDFSCGWYVGPSSDRLAERGRAGTAAEAVAWGRARTTRVRIRTGDARSYWAGTAPRPDGITDTWSNETATEVHSQGSIVTFEESGRPGNDEATTGQPLSELDRQLAEAP